jgi:transcriptional regulator GlxA family with amidase domain
VFDDVKMLDVIGPAEVFAEANAFGAAYELSYVSITGAHARTSIGTEIIVAGSTTGLSEVGTFVVPGGDKLVSTPIPRELVSEVRRLSSRAQRVVSVCTGSFVLAAAGILDGLHATTHWRHADLLAKAYPRIDVRADSLFVQDGGVFTSAGVSAGIDLALALVEQDYGSDVARSVARNLVVFMQRPGGQSQFSAPLNTLPPRTSILRSVLERVSSDPAADHSIRSLASAAGVSPRHLARLFRSELDTTPARFVESVRLGNAQAMIDAGHSVASTARAAGFGSPETLRRSFVARLGVSPTQYRARFAQTGPGTSPPSRT